MPSHSENRPAPAATLIAVAVLVVLTLTVFGQTLRFDFVGYDDPDYVYQNSHVQKGLSTANTLWAFTATQIGTWQPLTWVSLMTDYQIYGLNPGGYHATNVVLHLASVLLVFLFLRRATGAFWRSFFVAALFAIHPLRVESVAWVTERKDVLSGLFWMLALVSYQGYVRRGGVWRYLCVFLWFACGLASKPMVLTLPFALLLLDYWPFVRASDPAAVRKLLWEKAPLIALAILSAAITFYVQDKAGAVRSVEDIPVLARLLNVPVAYAAYILKTIWPLHLAVLYPHPGMNIPLWQVGGSLALLAAISWGVLALGKRYRYLPTGWWWFLITLLPVIGIIQIGEHQYADRFSYLPCLGLYMMLVWGLRDAARSLMTTRSALLVSGAIIVLIYTGVAWKQTGYWKNSLTLFAHTLAVTRNNKVAEANYGGFLYTEGRRTEAMEHYRRALRIDPDYPEAWQNIGLEYLRQGKVRAAIEAFEKALKEKPNSSLYLANYATALQSAGRPKEAEEAFRTSLRSAPGSQLALENYGYFLLRHRRAEEALEQFKTYVQFWPNDAHAHVLIALGLHAAGKSGVVEELQTALRLDPDSAEARLRLGDTLKQEGQVAQAVQQYRAGLSAHPKHTGLLNNLAWTLATTPDRNLNQPAEALKLAKRAAGIHPGDPGVLDTLAACQAAAGEFDAAAKTQESVLALLQKAGKPSRDEAARLNLYLRGQRFYTAR